MDLEYEARYEKNIFNNIFTIQIVNPYAYMVPFPIKPKNIRSIKKLIIILKFYKYKFLNLKI
jgi:hypothetical protein